VSLEVIGAGFGRTGTLSLKAALEQLGYVKTYHMVEVFEHPAHREIWAAAHRGEPIDWNALFGGYLASVDWPSCNLWREQMAAFPDAKVVLSVRDGASWYKSVMTTIYPTSTGLLNAQDPNARAFGEWATEIIWKRVFDGRMDDEAHAIDVFERHNAQVKAEVPADRLLVFEARQGWGPLCEFLGKPVPETPYPRTNTSEQFVANNGPPRPGS